MSSTSSRTPPATADSPTPGPAAGASTDGRWVAIAMILAGSAGALASAALIVEKVAVLADPTNVPSCSINPVISCGSVMMSWQAELLGFPNPVLGLAGFPVVAASGAAILAGGHLRRWYWLALLAPRGTRPAFFARYAPTILIAWLAVVATLIAIPFRDYWATLLF